MTGWEVSLFVFYALPVFTAVWILNLRAGLALAFLCGGLWWIANRQESPYATEVGYAWAMINRLVYFCFVAVGGAALRRRQEADAERIKMLEEMRQLEGQIINASEHEQQRIGRDLHDGLCQQLAAIGCAARLLADELQESHHSASDDAANIEDAIRSSVEDARSMAHSVFPVHMDTCGLPAALERLADSAKKLTGIEVKIIGDLALESSQPDRAIHLYRIAQEALSNAINHGRATSIAIHLGMVNGTIQLQVQDNGSGLPARGTPPTHGMGLRTMRYRAKTMGGTVGLTNLASGGACLTCRLPPGNPT